MPMQAYQNILLFTWPHTPTLIRSACISHAFRMYTQYYYQLPLSLQPPHLSRHISSVSSISSIFHPPRYFASFISLPSVNSAASYTKMLYIVEKYPYNLRLSLSYIHHTLYTSENRNKCSTFHRNFAS